MFKKLFRKENNKNSSTPKYKGLDISDPSNIASNTASAEDTFTPEELVRLVAEDVVARTKDTEGTENRDNTKNTDNDNNAATTDRIANTKELDDTKREMVNSMPVAAYSDNSADNPVLLDFYTFGDYDLEADKGKSVVAISLDISKIMSDDVVNHMVNFLSSSKENKDTVMQELFGDDSVEWGVGENRISTGSGFIVTPSSIVIRDNKLRERIPGSVVNSVQFLVNTLWSFQVGVETIKAVELYPSRSHRSSRMYINDDSKLTRDFVHDSIDDMYAYVSAGEVHKGLEKEGSDQAKTSNPQEEASKARIRVQEQKEKEERDKLAQSLQGTSLADGVTLNSTANGTKSHTKKNKPKRKKNKNRRRK